MVGARVRAIYDRQAKERQREGQERGRDKQKGIPANLPESNESDAGDARDQAGEAVGVSGKLIDDATKVLKRGAPELVAAVDAGKIAVSTAARAIDAIDYLRVECEENTCRKDFTPEEAVYAAQAIEEMEREEAKKRMEEGGRAGGVESGKSRSGGPSEAGCALKEEVEASGKLPDASTKGDARDKVASAIGMSGRTYEKAKAVVAARENLPMSQFDLSILGDFPHFLRRWTSRPLSIFVLFRGFCQGGQVGLLSIFVFFPWFLRRWTNRRETGIARRRDAR